MELVDRFDTAAFRSILYCRILTLVSFFALYNLHTAAAFISFSNYLSKENSVQMDVNTATDF